MSSKRYYWIKLRTDFFDLPTIDWLQDQEKGCDYIVLYQKLCMLTANNGGELSRKIGEMIISYDIKKISELTRFDFDTVAVALELYKKIGLVYKNENGMLVIANIDDMVGSETESAARVRRFRERKRTLQCNDKVIGNVTNVTLHCNTDIDIEKDIDKEIEKDIECPATPDCARSRANTHTHTHACTREKGKNFALTKKQDNTQLKEQAEEIINYLNAKLNTKYKTDNKKTLELIKARIGEGFTVEDFKTVIDKKAFEWADDANMCQYLRPVTLFATKFESYLNQPFTKQMTNSEKNLYDIMNHEFKGDYFDD